jgi:N-acetylmuramic acid 6-phosphate etherase
MQNLTETSSLYDDLEKMSVAELLRNINEEDKKVAIAVEKAMPQIEDFLNAMIPRISEGGRLFYIGAGTSGRLGVLDASECPPTYGVPPDIVIGLIAGGDHALRHPVEFAEDNIAQAWADLTPFSPQKGDVLVGIAASGTTPYVIGGLQKANEEGLLTACITCNYQTPMADIATFPIEVLVGPEFVTGSTRMKAGTAQKMVLNIISTTLMIKLGRVKGNKMVDMQLSNQKLILRGVKMVMQSLNIDAALAEKRLLEEGSVRAVIEKYG